MQTCIISNIAIRKDLLNQFQNITVVIFHFIDLDSSFHGPIEKSMYSSVF